MSGNNNFNWQVDPYKLGNQTMQHDHNIHVDIDCHHRFNEYHHYFNDQQLSHIMHIQIIICFLICIVVLKQLHSKFQSQSKSKPKQDSKKNSSKNYFIFGYGSLINGESRKQTGITGKAIPVRVHHMKRGWIYHVDKLNHPNISNTPFTAVGAQFDPKNYESTVNGVIFPIEYDEIHKYDEREARYHRYEINPKDIELINMNYNDDNEYSNIWNGIIYVYIVPDEIALSLDDKFECKRILKQSYIDKMMSGCLDIYGLDFALECIKTTNGWNAIYENDREKSTFSKTKISTEMIQRIDDIMTSSNYLKSLLSS